MKMKSSGKIAAGVGIALMFFISCLICYFIGYKVAKASEVDPITQAKSITVGMDATPIMTAKTTVAAQKEREQAEQERQAELTREAEAEVVSSSVDESTFTPATQGYTPNGGVEQWRGLITQCLTEQLGYVPPAHMVDEWILVMGGWTDANGTWHTGENNYGDPNAENGDYVGLMQYGVDSFWTRARLKDPYQNLTAAAIMYKQDRWGPWSVKPPCGGCF